MLVVVNPHAHGGKGAARWSKLQPLLEEHHRHRAVLPDGVEAARQAVLDAGEAGERVIVAAGGDGALNLVLNALMDPACDRPRWPVTLGAIGLGSSNDFHKPRRPEAMLGGVPIALDPARARLVDVGRADWLAPDGRPCQAYFLLNASMGAVAKGNERYNHPDGLLAWVKARHTDAAIQLATIEALTRFENVPAHMAIDGADLEAITLSNLGVIKRPYFAGGMHYDTPVQLDDGLFDVNLCHDMSRFEFVRAAVAILGGRFTGLPKTRHWRANRVRIVPDAPAVLELDGEVYLVKEATLAVIPRALQVCG